MKVHSADSVQTVLTLKVKISMNKTNLINKKVNHKYKMFKILIIMVHSSTSKIKVYLINKIIKIRIYNSRLPKKEENGKKILLLKEKRKSNNRII